VGYGLETVVLRYFNVFGPRQDPGSQYSAVIPKFISALLDGNAPTINGDGEQSRDFTFIENVVHANLLAVNAEKASGRLYNIACGGNISIMRLQAKLQELIGTDVEPNWKPTRASDVRHSLADISRARAELGYEPVVSIDEGLARTVEHYCELRRAKQRADAQPAA
jgi:UDP-glucose 4-epimerase